MKSNQNLEALWQEVSSTVLLKTVDEVMIDYSIMSAKNLQSASPDDAADNIRNLKLLRDTLHNIFD